MKSTSIFTVFRESLERMVAADKTGDAIESMLLIEGLDCSHRNELLVHLGYLRRIERKARLGIDIKRIDIERRRINSAVLELYDEAIYTLDRSKLPVKQAALSIEVPSETSLEKIIGVSHLKSIAWLEMGLRCSRAVCRVSTRKGMGTGFLINKDTIVTNHHVLPTLQDVKSSMVTFNLQTDLHDKPLKSHSYCLNDIEVVMVPEMDVTIAKVRETNDNPRLTHWGHLNISTEAPPATGEHVSIIQHPGGGPKQIACTANQVVNIFEHRLQYVTDTLPGSSGSPVFDDRWNVVAVHHAGGNLKCNSKGDFRYVNEGIIASRVPALLEACRR